MKGIDHYRQAEQLLKRVHELEAGSPAEAGMLAEAQVHATLALAAATARGFYDVPAPIRRAES